MVTTAEVCGIQAKKQEEENKFYCNQYNRVVNVISILFCYYIRRTTCVAESFFMSNPDSPHKDCHMLNVSMLGEVEMVEQGGEEGAEGESSRGICGL